MNEHRVLPKGQRHLRPATSIVFQLASLKDPDLCSAQRWFSSEKLGYVYQEF
jgi:hypothetical protein